MLYEKWQGMSVFTDYEEFTNYFNVLRALTTNTKLRSFQYRLLCKAIIFNDRVSKWDSNVSEQCSFCKHDKENMVHFFLRCHVVKEIYSQLEEYIKTICQNIRLEFCDKNVMGNMIHPDPRHLANFMLLVTKQYLYAAKCLKQTPSFRAIENLIVKYRSYEKYYAIKNNKLKNFCTSWFIYSEENVIYNGTGLDQDYVIQYVLDV